MTATTTITTAHTLETAAQGGMAVVAAAFLHESLVYTVPWLCVMMAVIICDLIAALRRCALMGETIRLSRAVRQTMGKMVTYTAFVLMVCMMEVAEGKTLHLDRWACLVICAVELSSIISNIMRPKGYDVDFPKLLTAVVKRLFGVDGDLRGAIKKRGETTEASPSKGKDKDKTKDKTKKKEA